MSETPSQPARRPSRIAMGCLGSFFGELALYAVFALLAGLLVLSLRGLDALAQDHRLVAGSLIVVLVGGLAYGGVWTWRIRPGLYLENLKGDPTRQAILGVEHRRARLGGMIFMQLACASFVGYCITVVVWSRP